MLSLTSKLLDVRTGEYNSLVFSGTRWDAGLQKEVESSMSVALNKDHLYLVEEYRKAIGQVISLPVRAALTKTKTIWYQTTGNGRFIVQPVSTAPKVA